MSGVEEVPKVRRLGSYQRARSKRRVQCILRDEPPANHCYPQTTEEKPVTQSAVFSMFGGGAKKEKKEEEDRGDVSGSNKAQREAAAAAADDVRCSSPFM